MLCVCTANLPLSPTVENLFQAWKGTWEAKSAGIMPDPSGNQLTQELVDWADLILVMEVAHGDYTRSHFQCSPEKIRVLNIPDRYFRGDPERVILLQKKVPPVLEKIDVRV